MSHNSRLATRARRANRDRWDDGEDRPDRRHDQSRGQHLKEKRLSNALRSRHIEELVDDDEDLKDRLY